MLATDALVATAMLQSVDNQTAQRTMVLAGVRQRLSLEDWRLFDASFQTTSSSRRVRHQFVHHYWGISDELPDCLLTQDPKDAHVELSTRVQRKIRTTVEEIDRSTMYVWTENDLLGEVESAKRALQVMASLEGFVYLHVAGHSTDSIRQRLLKDQAIRHRLDTLNKQTIPPVDPK